MIQMTLVGPPTIKHSGSTFPPLTLVHLATVLQTNLKHSSLSLKIIDLQLSFTCGELALEDRSVHDKVIKLVSPKQTDILLIPTMCNNLPFSINIAKICKTLNPSLIIVIGGQQASLVAKELIHNFPWIDVVVRGEGEETLVELIDALSKGDSLGKVNGLTYHTEKGIAMTPERRFLENLDILPVPDLSLLKPLSLYQSERSFGEYAMFIDVGRGCPFCCSFCITSMFWRHQFRQKSATKIVEDMNYLQDNYGIGHFYFNQDDFTANNQMLLAFCEEIIRCGRSYDWRIYSRLESLSFSTIELLAKANCVGIFCGIESASPLRQKKINKRTPLEDALLKVRALRKHCIECITSLIVGFPDETCEELNETLFEALLLAEQGATVSLQLLTPHPGTPIWNEYQEKIELYPDFYPYFDNAEFLTEMENNLIKRYPKIFTVFSNYPIKNGPFSKLFNIYYDYKRVLNKNSNSILRVVRASHITMTELHEMWRYFLVKNTEKSHEAVVDDKTVDLLFPVFLEGFKC